MGTKTKRPELPMTDGRNVDPALGTLSGEGSSQITESSRSELTHQRAVSDSSSLSITDPSYYDRPLLKRPVWGHEIPLYYFIGGAAGAALALAAAAEARQSPELGKLIARCRWIGMVGGSIGGVLLIYDLGRPSRFFNMLRVFRPTSPMNVGAWILSATVPAAAAAELLRGRSGILGSLGRLIGYLSGITGVALATYTGVLVSNSTIPLWQETRRTLPILFGASGVTAAASLLELMPIDAPSTSITRGFAFLGRASELGLVLQLEKHISAVPRVARPLKTGASGMLWRAAAIASAASMAASMLPKKTPGRRFLSGILGVSGSLLLRYAVHHAGVVSSGDARAIFSNQRGRE